MSPHTKSGIASLAKLAEGGNVAAGCELLRRAVVQLNQPGDLGDLFLSIVRAWLADPAVQAAYVTHSRDGAHGLRALIDRVNELWKQFRPDASAIAYDPTPVDYV